MTIHDGSILNDIYIRYIVSDWWKSDQKWSISLMEASCHSYRCQFCILITEFLIFAVITRIYVMCWPSQWYSNCSISFVTPCVHIFWLFCRKYWHLFYCNPECSKIRNSVINLSSFNDTRHPPPLSPHIEQK